jgi:hypothetical protein
MRQRESPGETATRGLIGLLNGPENMQQKRVIELRDSLDALFQSVGSGRWTADAEQQQQRVDELLKSYLKRWYVLWDGKKGFELGEAPPRDTVIPLSEFNAVGGLLWLVQNKKRDKLNRCRNCRRWYYRKFDHKGSCSEECRIQYHKSNPTVIERNRAKRNDRYQWSEKFWQITSERERVRLEKEAKLYANGDLDKYHSKLAQLVREWHDHERAKRRARQGGKRGKK